MPPRPRPAPLAPLDPVQRYSIPETIRYLRGSRFSVYRDIARDPGDPLRIEILKNGARTFVLGSEIIRRSRASQGSQILRRSPRVRAQPSAPA